MEFVEKFIGKDWNWCRDGITMEFVEKYIDKDWYWGQYGLSKNNFGYKKK